MTHRTGFGIGLGDCRAFFTLAKGTECITLLIARTADGHAAEGVAKQEFLSSLAASARSALAKAASIADDVPPAACAVAVPHNYAAGDRRSLTQCITAAGIPNVHLISETTAAAVAARDHAADAQEALLVILVCRKRDVEIGIVKCSPNQYALLGCGTSPAVSVDELRKLAVETTIPQRQAASLLRNPADIVALTTAMWGSLALDGTVAIEFRSSSGEVTNTIRFDRRTWRESVRESLAPLASVLTGVMGQARVSPSGVTDAIIVGAPTGHDAFQTFLRDQLGCPVRRMDESQIAVGAARYAVRAGEVEPPIDGSSDGAWTHTTGPITVMRQGVIRVCLEHPAATSTAPTDIDSTNMERVDAAPNEVLPVERPAEDLPPPALVSARITMERARRHLDSGQHQLAIQESHLAHRQLQAESVRDPKAEILNAMLDIHLQAANLLNSPGDYRKSCEWLNCADNHDQGNPQIRRALYDRHLLHAQQMYDAGEWHDAVQAAEIAIRYPATLDAAKEILQDARAALKAIAER